MKNITHLIILFFATVFLAQAQQPFFLDETQLPRFQSTIVLPAGVHDLPSSVHARGDFSSAIADSFQMALDQLLVDIDSKGLSAAVIANNGDEWVGASGISYVGADMTTDMYLGMGSLSKSITAACMLRLQEEGLVNLEDSIGKYLPPFPNVMTTITIRQLLNHTSGVYDFVEHPSMLDSMREDFSRIWQPEEVLNTFVKSAYFLPGQGWHYSNSNYVLAGLIIEQVTGQSYHEVVRQKLLAPQGLDSLFLNPYEMAPGEIAHVWFDFPSLGKFDLDAIGQTPISVYSSAWAAGGFFSRPILAAKWMSHLLNGDVLTPSSMYQMLAFVPANNIEYGLGLMKISDGTHQFIGHQGYIIYSSLCFYDPLTKLTVAIQSNDGSSTDLSPFLIKAYELYLDLVETYTPPTFLGKAYPNPAKDIVHLDLPQNLNPDYRIIATDLLGHRLTTKITRKDTRSIQLDVSHWGNGLFHIELWSQNQRMIYTVIR